MRAVWNMILDTLAIFYRLHILRYYDRTPSDALAPSYSKPTGQQPLSTATASAPLNLEEGAIEVSH
jgi:hypothetical protein